MGNLRWFKSRSLARVFSKWWARAAKEVNAKEKIDGNSFPMARRKVPKKVISEVK